MNDYQKRMLLFQSFKQLTEMIVIGGGGEASSGGLTIQSKNLYIERNHYEKTRKFKYQSKKSFICCHFSRFYRHVYSWYDCANPTNLRSFFRDFSDSFGLSIWKLCFSPINYNSYFWNDF